MGRTQWGGNGGLACGPQSEGKKLLAWNEAVGRDVRRLSRRLTGKAEAPRYQQIRTETADHSPMAGRAGGAKRSIGSGMGSRDRRDISAARSVAVCGFDSLASRTIERRRFRLKRGQILSIMIQARLPSRVRATSLRLSDPGSTNIRIASCTFREKERKRPEG